MMLNRIGTSLLKTRLIMPEGRIRKIWRNVRVTGHVKEVYGSLKGIQSAN